MRRALLASAAAALGLVSTAAAARVIEFEVTTLESPAFGGRVFGTVGTYDRILARAKLGLDPAEPHNAGIVDLGLAPKDGAGLVAAGTEVEILRPTDAAKGSDKLFFEVVNRGRRLGLVLFNDGPGKDDLADAAVIGNGFLMERGYTVVWAGWQHDAPRSGGQLALSLPAIQGVTGRSVEEFVFDNLTNPAKAHLTYPVAEGAGDAVLTVRARAGDRRQTPADLKFEVLGPKEISITRPAGFDAGAIYELVYTAKDPVPAGISLAVPRDVVSFLRHEKADASGRPNPLADRRFKSAIGFGLSQSGRYVRDFLYQGFNEDEAGRVVFEGLMPHIAGGKRGFFNARFAQPGRNVSEHSSHFYPGDQFPFTYKVTTDAVTGRSDGILARCLAARNCPKILQTDTELEVYNSRASLVVTDTAGAPLELPENVRAYLFANTPHFAPANATAQQGKLCRLPTNPLHNGAPMRALLVAMDEWLDGKAPPPSRYPSRADGTFVPPEADTVGMPPIPGLGYTGLVNKLVALDHATFPPTEGPAYPVFVGRTDGDGHTLAGVRLPALEAPRASYFGFNYRSAGYAEGALCDNTGASLPLARTKAERLAAGDPRPSLEERYPTPGSYVAAVEAAAAKLVAARLLLDADARQMVAAARAM